MAKPAAPVDIAPRFAPHDLPSRLRTTPPASILVSSVG